MDRCSLFGTLPQHEIDLSLGLIVPSAHDHPAARSIVGVADIAVRRDAPNEPVRHVYPHPRIRLRSIGRQHRPADARALTICSDEKAELFGRAAGKMRDDPILRLFVAIDALAKAVLDVAFHSIEEDAHEISAHDLALGR